MRLLTAELRKLTYQRAMWGMVLGGVLFSVLGTASTPVILDSAGDGLGFGALSEPAVVDAVYANAVSGFYFSMLLGVLVVAGEFRHGTAVATFVAVPRRSRVLLAKLLAAGIAGLVLQIVATGVGIASGWLALQFYPEAAAPFGRNLSQHGDLLVSSQGFVLGIVGAAIGALLRSQVLSPGGDTVVAVCGRADPSPARPGGWQVLLDGSCHRHHCD
jgi:ABC-type transport system involved in multi-copper enzyme maturation permease subunit